MGCFYGGVFYGLAWYGVEGMSEAATCNYGDI